MTPDLSRWREIVARYQNPSVKSSVIQLINTLGPLLLTFVVMDMLAALISVPISVILAWHFGAELELAAAWVKQGGRVILLGVAILAVMVAVRTWRRRHDLAALAEEDADDPDDPDASRDGERVEVGRPA